GADIWVSVRTKLILLFLFATLFPLAGLAGLAKTAIAERGQVMTDRTLRRAKAVLESIDAGYEVDRQKIRTIFRAIRDDAGLRSPDPEIRRKRVLELRRNYGVVKIELRDCRGGLVVSTECPEALARLENIFRVMAQIGLERQAPELVPPDTPGSVRQVDLMTRMAFDSPVMGLSAAMDQPDRVHNLDFSIMRGLWYWDVIRDPTHPAAFINMVKSGHEAVSDYLKQRFSARRKASDGFLVLAFNIDGGFWVGRKRMPASPSLQRLLNRSRVSGRAVNDLLPDRNVNLLAVAMPAVFLGRYELVALIPEPLATAGLTTFKTTIWLFFALIALAAVISGRLLADLFLKPVAELQRGMDALRGGNTNVRVAIESGDELGELGNTFNQMVEDLQEIQVAKLIQDSLVRAGKLDIPGFDGCVTLERASDLSGDYIDAVALPGGGWLLATGDVSGHGTSAALTMAMAKSLTIQCAEEDGDPVRLLEQTDRILLRLLNRRQMLFFTAAKLDPKTGEIEISSGGAPYPFVLRRNGMLETIRLAHLPLASSSRPAPFPRERLILEPGDMLMLYTDGLVKNHSNAGEPFGYERLESAIRAASRTDAAACSGDIMEKYRAFVREAPAADDLSILIIRRENLLP
ncbi:MAG TPA: SpoIIE family protein phosphatase, partial [Candidatus Ozemobacteraceae bacterium]|nr:SpoIIE family protein phosphatase [Candidatus Ozemobacteraceae bacterium]